MATAKYRNRLPQLNGTVMLSDGGMETTMVFHKNIDLPFFSATHLLRIENGEQIICDYFKPYIEIALASKRGLILGHPNLARKPGLGRRDELYAGRDGENPSPGSGSAG